MMQLKSNLPDIKMILCQECYTLSFCFQYFDLNNKETDQQERYIKYKKREDL